MSRACPNGGPASPSACRWLTKPRPGSAGRADDGRGDPHRPAVSRPARQAAPRLAIGRRRDGACALLSTTGARPWSRDRLRQPEAGPCRLSGSRRVGQAGGGVLGGEADPELVVGAVVIPALGGAVERLRRGE